MMGSGLIDKVLGFLKKDPDSAISKEAQQVLEKIPSLDLNELLRDIKSAKLLAEINKDPNNADNFIQLAEYYKNHKKIDNAINIYLSIAQRELEHQNFLQSSNYIQMAMKLEPDNGPLNMFSADIDIRTGKFAEAADKYRAAANYFIKKDDRLTAIYLLRRIMDMNRASMRDLLNLASIMIHEEMFDEAEKILNSVREKHRNGTVANLFDRESCLLMLYSMRKDDQDILAELIETRIELHHYENALVLLKKLVAKDPNNINFLKRQAFVYKQLNDIDNAVKIFKNIANIYAKQNNLIYRNIFYYKVLKYSPNDIEALSVLGKDAELRRNLDDKIENTDSRIRFVDLPKDEDGND